MNYTEWTLQEKDVIFRGCLLTSPGHQFLTVPRHCVRHSVSVPHRAISKVRKHSFSAHIDFLFVYFILRLRRLYDHAATAHHAPTAAHGTGAAKLDSLWVFPAILREIRNHLVCPKHLLESADFSIHFAICV